MEKDKTSNKTFTSDSILSWGSSVNVCEELRHQIRSEIEKVDEDIFSLKHDLDIERKSSNQLSTDLSCARSEMQYLRRESADQYDNAIVNEQIQLKMEESLRKELVHVVSPLTSPNSTSNDFSLGTSLESNSMSANNDVAKESHIDILSRIKREIKQAKQQIRHDIKEVNEILSKKDQISNEYMSNYEKINSKEFDRLKNEAILEVKKRQSENEKEMKNVRNVKEAIQRTRQLCGEYTQQIVEMSKLLSEEKSKNAIYEENVSSTLEEFKSDLQHQQSRELDALRKEDKSTSEDIKNYIQELSEVDEIRKRRASIHKQKTDIESEIGELKNIENELTVQEIDSKSNLKKSGEKLKIANKLDTDLNDLKQNNDKNEISNINPTLEKTKEIGKKNAKFSKDIADIQQKLSTDEEKYKMTIKKKKESISLIQIDMKKIEQGINKMKEEHECVQTQMSEAQAHFVNELATNEEIEKKFVKAIRAEEKRKLEKLEEKKLKREKRKKELVEEWELEHRSLLFKVRLCQTANELIEKTNQIVSQTLPKMPQTN